MARMNIQKSGLLGIMLGLCIVLFAFSCVASAGVSISGPDTVTRGGVSPGAPTVDGYFSLSVSADYPVRVGLVINPQTMTGEICDRPPYFIPGQYEFVPGIDQQLYPTVDRVANFSTVSPNGIDYPSAGCWNVPYNGLQYYGHLNTSSELSVGTLYDAAFGITSLKPGRYWFHAQKAEEPRNRTEDSGDYYVDITFGDVTLGFYDYPTWLFNENLVPVNKVTFGQKVLIAGVNTDSQDLYLWLKGKGLPTCGSRIELDSLPILSNDPTHINSDIMESQSYLGEYNLDDGTWYYIWDTSQLPLSEGEYTIYATSVDVTDILSKICSGSSCKSDICTEENGVCALLECPICGPYASATITLENPQLDTFNITQPEDRCCCEGYPCGAADYPVELIIRGYTGVSNQSAQVWMFGDNQIYDRNYIFDDSFKTFQDENGYFELDVYQYLLRKNDIKYCDLEPGDYYIVLQIPRVSKAGEEKFDVTLESSKFARQFKGAIFPGDIEGKALYIVQASPVMWTKVAAVEGPAVQTGYQILNKLRDALDQPWVEDQYVILKFTLRDKEGCGEGSVDLSAVPVSGNAPLSVQFYDTSTYNGSSWLWDFGDGITSTDQHPLSEYTAPGVYDVSLTVNKDGKDKSTTKYDYITVYDIGTPPVADYSYSMQGNLTVAFRDQSSGNPSARLWKFGDGTESIVINPVHTYDQYGRYDVELSVTNQAGSDTKFGDVYLPGPSELVEAKFEIKKQQRWTYKITDKSEGPILNWKLDFGDGTIKQYSAPGWTDHHTYTRIGSYLIRLEVSNGISSSSSSQRIIVYS